MSPPNPKHALSSDAGFQAQRQVHSFSSRATSALNTPLQALPQDSKRQGMWDPPSGVQHLDTAGHPAGFLTVGASLGGSFPTCRTWVMMEPPSRV